MDTQSAPAPTTAITTQDPRVQTDRPWDPLFESGAFSLVALSIQEDGRDRTDWMVYDAFEGRAHLVFADQSAAVDACETLNAAASSGDLTQLDQEYEDLRRLACWSLGQDV